MKQTLRSNNPLANEHCPSKHPIRSPLSRKEQLYHAEQAHMHPGLHWGSVGLIYAVLYPLCSYISTEKGKSLGRSSTTGTGGKCRTL